ncbi:hypothetical protein [Scopulibacillus darangshiensis]|uniref:hypothetical protein n=1 Tax=Scopulibacillus darangshiensis TaxID=442528 RepID=UPI00105333AB|nr:hypothetical protein [Scopulibacillus darangshiensis]
MAPDDFILAEWVTTKVKNGYIPEPWVAALEYGGVGPIFEWRSDINVLEQQVPRLFELNHGGRN